MATCQGEGTHDPLEGTHGIELHGGGGCLWGRTTRCARAVQTIGHFGPGLPSGQGARNNYRVPIRRTAQILTQSNTPENEAKQTMADTEDARMLSVFSLNLLVLWVCASPVVGGHQGGHRKATPPPLVAAPPCRTKKHGPPGHCPPPPPPSEVRIPPPPGAFCLQAPNALHFLAPHC